ncbi:MAG: hypothetical protein ACOYYS_23140 [Chloroflexota bacterium]
MDHALYEKYRRQYLQEAMVGANRSPAEIYRALVELPRPGRFTFHREEKARALRDLLAAFEDHRHWPLDIILSHLGLEDGPSA